MAVRTSDQLQNVPATTKIDKTPRVLIVDDDPDFQKLLRVPLESERFPVETAGSVAEMRTKMERIPFRVVLLDLRMPSENGLDALPWIVRNAPHTKVIVMTAYSSVETAVEAMKLGASSFVSKTSTRPENVVDEVKTCLKSAPDYEDSPPSDEEQLTQQLRNIGLIGQSRSMAELFDRIGRIRDVSSTVLITGESGTGKELIARAIHQTSKRRDGMFRAINCGAIPETLLESELFGHKKGAFTDAKGDRTGIFEICSNGTLLLDEIGDMPLPLQVKLLRVLQEGEVTPVGASKPVRINTRVIAATNRDLESEVHQGRFREDLFFRLSVLRVVSPPLRGRLNDIPHLVRHFIDTFNENFQKAVEPPSSEVLVRLMAYDWPGNIRELRNAIERGVALSQDGKLHIEDIFPNDGGSSSETPAHPGGVDCNIGMTLSEAKHTMEAEYIRRVLMATQGNISEAARISGIYRPNLYRLIDRHHISVREFKN